MENIIITYKSKNDKINKLINVINENKAIIHKYLILELIGNKTLNDHIKKIRNYKVDITNNSFISKGYLTGYEQFISILDNFITYVDNYINSPELEMNIISNCLNNSNVLSSNKYYYDIENIKFYKNKFNYAITYIFYNNLLKLKKYLKEELDTINLDISKIDMKNNEDVNYLINILEEIILVNRNDYKLLSLFTKIEEDSFDKNIYWYKVLLDKYINNKQFIHEYREFKKND